MSTEQSASGKHEENRLYASGSGSERSPELWLDRFARVLGFGWLAERTPGGLPPSYLYALLTIVSANLLMAAYNLSKGVPLIYRTNPYFVLQPILLLGAAYGARSLRASYDRVLVQMDIATRANDPDSLFDPVPSRVPWTLFVVGAGLQLARAGADMSAFGVTDMIANFVVFPFLYLPIVVQFFTVYLSIEVVGPWRLAKPDSGVGIHFLDPEGLGGLRPLGELIKRAYYYLGAGLIGYALITYAPFVESEWTVSTAAGSIFTLVWIGTIATVAFAVYVLHRFMRRERREEIHRLEARLKDRIEDPYDVAEYRIPDDEEDEVDDIRDRIERVRTTREYPATFSIWSQLLLSIVVPKAVQLLISSL